MKSQSGGRRWVAGALRAARAAAFLTLATGVNGTIAALQPRYEPIYVYLAAVVIVAWLGSVLLGVTTAIAAVILYDTMFAPAHAGPSWSSAVPFVVAIGAAVVTRLARVPLEKPRLPPTSPRPLLEAVPLVAVPPAAPEAESAARVRIEGLQRQLDEAKRLHDEGRTETETARRQLRASGARIDELTKRLDETTQELEVARRRADEETVRAEAAAKRAAALHQQIDESSRRDQAIATRIEELTRFVEEEKVRSEAAAKREEATAAQTEAMRRQLRSSGARIDELTKRLDETTQELEVAWRRVDEEKARSDAEARRLTELERQANDALQRAVADLAARYQEPLAEAKKSLADAFTRIPLIERERDDAQAASLLADQRQTALQDEVDRVRVLLESETARAEQESSLREEAETARDEATAERDGARAELRDLASRLSSLEQQLENERHAMLAAREEAVRARDDAAAQFAAQRIQAEAQVATLANQIDRLESELSEARARADAERAEHEKTAAAFDDKIASIAAGLTSDYENALGEATVEKEAARAEVRTLTSRVTTLRAELAAARKHAEAERAEHEKAIAAFDRKITSIVTNITTDHENAIAEAMLEREAARAEARSMNQRLEAGQRKLNDFRVQVEKTTFDLRRSVETERARADAERAAREKSEAEWSEKLQRIVSNIAGDHESDLGDALIEREAARAEARQLSGKLKTLQQTLDQERFRSSPQEKPTLTVGAKRPAVVLVVHSDAGMRAMSKHTLEQTGYTVLTAADGLEGLRTASTHRPDVVLTEAVMPKMNGRELVQLLKARSETAGIRIVLMGGQSGADAATDFRADDYLQSPSDFAAMRATVANVLAK